MGTKGREIVGVEVKELVKLLNKALADEWLAVYQYWAGSKVAVGRMRGIIAKELEEHAKEELEHANKLTDRIIQLGGSPLINPEQWKKKPMAVMMNRAILIPKNCWSRISRESSVPLLFIVSY